MSKSDLQRFKDGHVIFREGEASHSAYVLVEGSVSLTKGGDKGAVTLALLQPGELFGEMSLLDEGLRSATARAIGAVAVRIIPRDEFLDALDNEPETARSVMGKLVERLRVANDMVVRGPAKSPPPQRPSQPRAGGFFARFFGLGGGRARRLEVRVADLAGEAADSARSDHVAAGLDRRPGLRTRRLKHRFELDPDVDLTGDLGVQLTAAAVTGRTLLVTAGADLLVWGEIPPPGPTLCLRFLSRHPEDEDGPAIFGLATSLRLPVDFAPESGDILSACALAATVPADQGAEVTRRDALPKAIDAALGLFNDVPTDLTSRERASVNVCFATAMATNGAMAGGTDRLEAAIAAYRAGLEAIGEAEEPVERALVLRNLGVALQTRAERHDDIAILEESLECYRGALKGLTRQGFPRPWAAVQNRIGMVLHRLDMKTGDTELVKHALAAFQASLQVYTRREAPQRWAEIMGNFAKSALMLGQELRNEELLQKAADACAGVLQVRSREAEPLPWAATQNNLGSALFLLARLKGESELLGGAVDAFSQAGEVYRDHDAVRLLAIAERNLERVEAQIQKVGSRSLPRMRWEEDGAE